MKMIKLARSLVPATAVMILLCSGCTDGKKDDRPTTEVVALEKKVKELETQLAKIQGERRQEVDHSQPPAPLTPVPRKESPADKREQLTKMIQDAIGNTDMARLLKVLAPPTVVMARMPVGEQKDSPYLKFLVEGLQDKDPTYTFGDYYVHFLDENDVELTTIGDENSYSIYYAIDIPDGLKKGGRTYMFVRQPVDGDVAAARSVKIKRR
jgi:outer membrane murein-binding lipoprotein Lpp